MTRLRLAVLIALWIFSSTVLAFAQADPDPPSRVARLNYVKGDVSFQPGGVDDWTDAELNRPLTIADRLWTDRESQAELHIGSAALRLGPETSFTLANLDDHSVQLQLAQGTLNLRVRALAEDDSFEVDTPNVTFLLLHPGDYRVDVDSEGQTSFITVRSGSGELAVGGQRLTLRTGQQGRFSAGEHASSEINEAPARDQFDQWCLSRSRHEDEVMSARYVSPEVTGYEDLDTHGDWREEAGYGPVWVPRRVAVDWAPYRYGHWAWVFPWGWTWIDDSPWGFAPFHYGRWVHLRYGWGWVPGPRVVRPVYAPALVAWIGGNDWAIGVSTGRPVGWFPLGPREVYVPAYRASHTYVRNVNITNTNITIVNVNDTRIDRVHVNQHVRGAVTAVPDDVFINSHPVHRSVLNIREDRLKRVQVVSAAPLAPAPRSVLGREGAPGHRPPERVLVRPVVSRKAPPRPVPFELQRRTVANDGTIHPVRPQDFPEMRRPQPVSPDRPGVPADVSRGRGTMLPDRRADADREHPPDRGRSNDDAEPRSGRPTFRDVPRPDRDRQTSRGQHEDVGRAEEHGRSNNPARVVPRPAEQNVSGTPEQPRDLPRPRQERVSDQPKPNAPRPIAAPPEQSPGSRTPEPMVRDVPRPPQGRMPERARPSETRTMAPPQQSPGPRTPEPVVRDVPRPRQERMSEQARPSEPRTMAPPQQSPGPRTPEPAVRDVPRPPQGRMSEQARPSEPRTMAPPQQSPRRSAPEPVVREAPRPVQERVSEQPRPSAPRVMTPSPQQGSGSRAPQAAVRESPRPQGNAPRVEQPQQRQTGNSRPTNSAERPASRPSQGEKAAPQNQEDKSKSRPGKGDRS